MIPHRIVPKINGFIPMVFICSKDKPVPIRKRATFSALLEIEVRGALKLSRKGRYVPAIMAIMKNKIK